MIGIHRKIWPFKAWRPEWKQLEHPRDPDWPEKLRDFPFSFWHLEGTPPLPRAVRCPSLPPYLLLPRQARNGIEPPARPMQRRREREGVERSRDRGKGRQEEGKRQKTKQRKNCPPVGADDGCEQFLALMMPGPGSSAVLRQSLLVVGWWRRISKGPNQRKGGSTIGHVLVTPWSRSCGTYKA